MVSFDVRSLFTNMPLRKTIAICLDRLYRSDPSIRPGIPEKTLKKMLELCVCDKTFLFNGKVYKQIDGVAMGSSLGPAWLFDSLVGKLLNNIYDPPPTSYAVPKVKVFIVLPYLGYISIYVSRKLRRLISFFL